MVSDRDRMRTRVVAGWRRWTAPSRSVTHRSDRWRARLLASLTLTSVPLLVVVLVTLALTSSRPGAAGFLALSTTGLLGSYLMARSPRWRLGAWLAVLTVGATSAVSVTLIHQRASVTFVGLAVIIAGMVLRKRDTLLVTGLALAWLWVAWARGALPYDPVEGVLISCFFVALGMVLGVSLGLRESIERRRVEELAKSEERYRGLLEVAFEGFVVLRDDRIVDLNPGFLELTGRSRSELVGRELEAILMPVEPEDRPDEEATLVSRPTKRAARPGLREASGKRPDGEVFFVEMVDRTQHTALGPVCYVAVRDVTERRRAVLQLSIAHRAVALGTLSAGIAHEINNPLSWMMTNLQTVQDELDRGSMGRRRMPGHDNLQHALEDALQGGRRVMSIVRDLKTLSREGAQAGVADVHAALDLACRIASRQIEARARLVRDYGHVPPVSGSSGRLGQVFLNLLTNAVQAIPEGERDMHRITLRTRSRDGAVEVTVRDDGRGIPASVLPHIFDPFFTTKGTEEGTGLGLPITRSIVDGLGGSISVQSREGEGATFTLRLPVAERTASIPRIRGVSAPRISRPEPGAEPSSTAPARVLVIDDEPLLGKSLSRALHEYEVLVTEDPARALELCSEADFDVIVCDLMMPGISGEQVYDTLAERAPEMAARMIFMTGGAFTETSQRFLERIDNPVLNKPFSPNDLRIAVRRMLDAA